LSLLPAPHSSSVPAARTYVLDVIPRARYTCSHCGTVGSTGNGALWRVSLRPEDRSLYYLHARCRTPYKHAHGLKSVEGRIPCALPAARR